MAQHDYTIANQTFPLTRQDINNLAAAVVTNNSGASEPTTMYNYQWWFDTNTNTLKFRNADNDAWISFATFDMVNDTVNLVDSAVDIVTDLSPQLGANLDLNSNDITGTGNINITGTATVTGITTTGDINFGDNDKANFGASNDLQIYHNGTDSIVSDEGTGKLVLSGNTAVEIRGTNGEDLAGFNMNGAVNLYYDNSKKFQTTAAGVFVTGNISTGDNGKFISGTSADLQIYHDGSNSYIMDSGTGGLDIRGHSNIWLRSYNTGETFIDCTTNGAVNIYYDGSKKFETTSSGATVTGTLTATAFSGDGSSLTGISASVADGSITMAKLSTSATEGDNVKQRVAKVWCNWNMYGGTSIRDDFNVSSITDNGLGDSTINFSTSLANANYSFSGMAGYSPVGGHLYLGSRTGSDDITVTTSSLRVGTSNLDSSSRTLNDTYYNTIIIFGDS